MKWTVILAGLLSASLLAVAQDPTGIVPAQTNRANQPAVFPDTSRPQQLNTTNQTNWGSSTNTPSAATNSTSGTGPSSSSHITIIKGSDTSTSERHLPPNGDGVEVVTNTTGTANDWRSGGSTPHAVPPRQSAINP
jgi:hypothetical protein